MDYCYIVTSNDGQVLGVFDKMNKAVDSVSLSYSATGHVNFDAYGPNEVRAQAPNGDKLRITGMPVKTTVDHL